MAKMIRFKFEIKYSKFDCRVSRVSMAQHKNRFWAVCSAFYLYECTFNNRLYQRRIKLVYPLFYMLFYRFESHEMRKEKATKTTTTSTDKINVLGIITERANRYQWFQNGHNLILRKREPSEHRTLNERQQILLHYIHTHFWRSTFLLCPLHLLFLSSLCYRFLFHFCSVDVVYVPIFFFRSS